jgi:hypothetical protein
MCIAFLFSTMLLPPASKCIFFFKYLYKECVILLFLCLTPSNQTSACVLNAELSRASLTSLSYGFTSHSRIFHLLKTSPLSVKGCKILAHARRPRAFEQGGIFIVPHLLWHGTSVFPVSSEGPPHSVASYDTRRGVKDLFSPGFSRGEKKEMTIQMHYVF